MLTTRPTHATRTRNLIAPHADKLAVGLTFSEGSGTAISNLVTHLSLTDLGAATATSASCAITSATGGFTSRMVGKYLVITAGTNWLAGAYLVTAYTDTNTITVAGPVGSSATLTNGSGKLHETGRRENVLWGATVGGSGASWSGETLSMTTSTTLSLTTNGTGATLTWYRGTIAIQRTFSDLSSARTLFRNSITSSTNGHRGMTVATDGVRFNSRAAGVTTTLHCPVTIANDDEVFAVLQWRKTDLARRLVVSVNGGTPVFTAWTVFAASNMSVTNSAAFTFNEDGGAVAAGTIKGFYWWDWALDDEDVIEYLVDPHLAARPLLDSDLVQNTTGPIVGQPIWWESDYTATFQFAGATSMTVGGTPEEVEVRFYSDEYCVTEYGPGARHSHTFAEATDEGKPIQLTPGDVLARNARYYWKVFVSTDGGSTWLPGPGPRGTLYTGSDGAILFVSDDHSGTDGITTPEGGYDLGIPNSTTTVTGREDRARNWIGTRDLRKYCLTHDVSLIVHVGDGLYAPASTGGGFVLGVNPTMSLGAPVVWTPGNHESLFPFLESVSDAEYAATDSTHYERRREAMVRWKQHTCNPAPDTYDSAVSNSVDWGENEGEPAAEPGDDVTAWDPDVEWHAGMTDGANTYANSFVRVSTGGTWTEDLGLNNSPRGTFCAIPMGLPGEARKTLLVVLDATGYAAGASPNYHSNVKSEPWGRLGKYQSAWAESVMAWGRTNGYDIIVVIHNWPDGRGLGMNTALNWYGRGMFPNETLPNDKWLAEKCREHKVRCIVHGHDHGGAIGRAGNLTVVACPTLGNNFRFTQTAGPELDTTNDQVLDYGKASVQGTDQDGIFAHWCQWGYLIYDQSAKTVTFRNTAVDLTHARYFRGLGSTGKFVGRYFGEVLTSTGLGNATVSEVPYQVYAAVAADDGDFEAHPDDAAVLAHANYATWQGYDILNQAWADSGAGDACAHAVDMDQPFDTAVVNCGVLAAVPVRVCHAPRNLGTYSVPIARSTSGGGGALHHGLGGLS